MSYNHGIYTESVSAASMLKSKSIGTIPLYIGTAPVHMTDGKAKANTPVLINSYNDFVKTMGYSDMWENFTLCEAAYAHFKNNIETIAPFVVINILDIDKHIKSVTATDVTFTNKVGYLANANNLIIVSTLASTEAGENFVAEYTNDNRIKITLTGDATLTSAKFSYSEVDLTKVQSADFEAGISAIDTVTIKCGVTPNIICAPKFSSTYAKQLTEKCESLIGGKWGCVAYIDIPTDTVKTLADAINYKATNFINSKLVRLHYPKSKFNGKVFHLSVLDAVTTQIVDNNSDGVSCYSSSNKRIICDVPVLDANTELIYSEGEANAVNAKGITTINYIGGSFRLWGGHMSNYDYESIDGIEAKDRSDATVRMQIYLDNWLKREHIDNIDAPLTRRDIDNVISNVNIGLNSFVNSGYLLKGECYFDGSDNAIAELADGNLVLDVSHTEVPNGKSINFKLQYDTSGLEALYEEAGV